MSVVDVVYTTVSLLLVAAGSMAIAKKLRVPFTVLLVVVGVALAQLAHFAGQGVEEILSPKMPPEIIFFVLLPTLIFESAFNLDARALRENLSPVLTLAIPGLLISTALIGSIMALTTDLGWPVALLLGSILSATDPVAVISLFRQLGAPKRLTVLVEGESLFNDATAIVLSNILVGIMAVGVITTQTVTSGAGEFLLVFLGGLAVGWLAAVLVGLILGRVEGDVFIEISLTTVLAYFSFVLAEETLKLSGVMATVAAGMVIGGWGKAKISASIAGYMVHFWEYTAMVANALIFLLVGLQVGQIAEFSDISQNLPALGWVILAMLFSRALVIFGLVPLVGRLPGSDPVDIRYQTVMFWGGLRGGVALAIALSLEFPAEAEGLHNQVVFLVAGAVMFTLIFQGLSIEYVVRRFGLHVPPLSDRLARVEGLLSAKTRTLEQIPELQAGGLFAPRIAESVRERCEQGIATMKIELELLRADELNLDEERKLLHLRCFGVENTLYYRMFSRGHLSESAYRNLTHSIELQTEGIRHNAHLPGFTLHPPTGERFENVLYRLIDLVPGLGGIVERFRANRTARDYEIAWARSRGSRSVLNDLNELAEIDQARPDIVDESRAAYEYWHENARGRLDQNAELFPEFVSAAQERLADRLVLHAEREAIEEKAHSGIIPEGVAETMLQEMADELRTLRASQAIKLHVSPEELLKKVPFFLDTPAEEFALVSRKLRRRTAPAGEVIVRQGASGSSLFLVARGVIRVSLMKGDESEDLATLMAGDFFGETALLHHTPRNATCRAVTPCALYELRRDDLDEVRSHCPAIQSALESADSRRRTELRQVEEDL